MMRLGLAVFAVGGLADVLYHVLTVPSDAPAPGAFWAHLVTLVGMVLTMLGILTARGWQRNSSKSQATDHPVLKISREV